MKQPGLSRRGRSVSDTSHRVESATRWPKTGTRRRRGKIRHRNSPDTDRHPRSIGRRDGKRGIALPDGRAHRGGAGEEGRTGRAPRHAAPAHAGRARHPRRALPGGIRRWCTGGATTATRSTAPPCHPNLPPIPPASRLTPRGLSARPAVPSMSLAAPSWAELTRCCLTGGRDQAGHDGVLPRQARAVGGHGAPQRHQLLRGRRARRH